MKEIDKWAQKSLGIPGTVLMENAGRGCVEIIKKYFELPNLKVLIFCGKGNNGGDGLVIARHLNNSGSIVKVILLNKGNELKGDALINYNIAKKSNIEIFETTSAKKLKNIINDFSPECIIDAIFGTGFKGTPEGIYYRAIELINNYGCFIFSIDVPSGVNGDTGEFERTCIIADATATMCLPKRGNYLYPGRDFSGNLHLVDIGTPLSLINNGFPRLIEYDEIHKLLPFRPPDGNKGTFGYVLTVAGARGFSGAAAMAAISALKVGAGFVRLAAPKGIMDALEAKLLEVVKIPLEQTDDETINTKAIDTLLPILEKSDVVVIGPGITTNPETADFIFKFLPEVKVPLIIDADAINIIAQNIKFLKKLRAPFILTPHPGELARLIKIPSSQINRERIDLAKKYAKELGGVLVLKGAPTIIASPKGEVYINPTGNSGLATAGSGDVLVGMISGFLAQALSPLNASMLGVFLHGLCAQLATAENNEYSLIAGDLIDYIPKSINYILNREYEKKEM